MASRLFALRSLSSVVRAPRPTAATLNRVCCYSTEHHYTGDTGQHHAHQDGMPKSRNFAAEIGDKLSPKMKQQQYESSTGSSSHDAHNKAGKEWDPLERELRDNEWDQIGNL